MADKPKKKPPELPPRALPPTPPPRPPDDFAKRVTEALRRGESMPEHEPEPLPAPLPRGAPPPPPTSQALLSYKDTIAQVDRAFLTKWWQEQMAHVEFVVKRRAELLAAATEHPNAIFSHQALRMGAMGMPKDVVGQLLGLSEEDLDLYYGHEYALGAAEITGQVAANFTRIALSSDDRFAVKAAAEFLNRRGGETWAQPAAKIDLRDSREPKKGALIDPAKLTYDQRQTLRAILIAARTGAIDVPAAGVLPAPEADQ